MFLALKIHESETQEQFGLKRQIGILWYIGRGGETTRFLVLGFLYLFFQMCRIPARRGKEQKDDYGGRSNNHKDNQAIVVLHINRGTV